MVRFWFYVPETHIMYFIRRCWFLKCSEEIHYVPIGDGDTWYYVPVDDGWEEVLGRNVYITSQYWDIMYTLRQLFWPLKKVLAPSKCPSKWLIKLLSHKKKIMSRSFLNREKG